MLEPQLETRINEIADEIYRLSTYVAEIEPPAGFVFNQFLIVADEPLLFHTGHRRMFPMICAAVSRLIDPSALRWISFGHFEADECGSMNDWLSVARGAEIAHGNTCVSVSLTDMADRPPRVLADAEAIDLGDKKIRYFDTPHTPHGWDAGVMYEETTGTLLCGDLFTQLGDDSALTDRDIVGPAVAAEDLFDYSSLNPAMGTTIRRLAALAPRTLGLMHGPSFNGDCTAALHALADDYDRRAAARGVELAAA